MNKSWEKVKNWFKRFNVKTLLKILFLLALVILVGLMSFLGVGVNEKFDFKQWLVNFFILIGLVIISMFLGESIGKDKQETATNGLYQKNLQMYYSVFDETNHLHIYLDQFLIWFKTRETYAKKVNYLLDRGILEAEKIIKHVNLENVEQLKQGGIKIGDNEYIRKVEDAEQYEAIMAVLGGKVKVTSPSSVYYLDAFTESHRRSELEEPEHLDKMIKMTRRFKRAFKIIGYTAMSAVLATLVIQQLAEGNYEQAFYDLFTRLVALIGGLFSGFLTAVLTVKFEARKIGNKINILKKLKTAFETKEFIPINDNEIAEKEYKEWLEKEEERQKAVITPEIVEPENINDIIKEEDTSSSLMIEHKED